MLLHRNFNTLALLGAAPPARGSSCTDPGSSVGVVFCGPSSLWGWLSAVPGTLWAWIQVWWPLVAAMAAMALVAGAALAVVVRRKRCAAADSARWVEIVPAAAVPRDGAHALWRALTGMLHRTRARGLAPRRLAVEFVGDERGVRVGVWVPPALSHRRVGELVGQVWPGARVREAGPPRWLPTVDGARIATVDVSPQGGPWTPLLDPGPRLPRPVDFDDADPLRGLFAILALQGLGQAASVQLVVTALRGTRARGRRRWWARGLLLLLLLPLRALLAVADLFLPGQAAKPAVRSSRSGEPVSEQDVAEQARRKDIAAKQGRGPHLRVTLRVLAASPGPRRDRRDTLDALVDGLASAAPLTTLTTRTVRATVRADQRRPSRWGFAATVGELAALWHLPTHPDQYGMRVAAARTRPPGRDIPRINPVLDDPTVRLEDDDDDLGYDDGHDHGYGDGAA